MKPPCRFLNFRRGRLETRVTPRDILKNGRLMLALSIQIHEAIDKGRLIKDLSKTVKIETGGEGVTIQMDWEVDQRGASDTSWNCLWAVFGAVTTALRDQWLIGLTINETSDPEFFAAREIIRHIRNAFNHSPTSPVWCIDKPHQRKVYVMNSAKLRFDGTSCNGKAVKPDDFGGFEGFLRLLNFLDSKT